MIAVIGGGYVGLTTAACLASNGVDVIVVDTDTQRIADYLEGDVLKWVNEPDLDRLVKIGVNRGTFHFTTDYLVSNCDTAFICVPTPQSDTGAADLTYVRAAVSRLAETLPSGAAVVMKSTAPVGTAKIIRQMLDSRRDIEVLTNPEFLREGQAIHDFLHPDRLVVGGEREAVDKFVDRVYGTFRFFKRVPIFKVTCEEAELIKYASNAFLATKVSFANELAWVCHNYGADAFEVLAGLGSDVRVGSLFLRPGPGWGGSCFPKDTAALLSSANRVGLELSVVRAAVAANDQQIGRVEQLIRKALGGDVAGCRICVWGITFKPGTNDIRNSVPLQIVQDLIGEGAHVIAADPQASFIERQSFKLMMDPIEAARDANVIVVLTEDPAWRQVDLKKVVDAAPSATIVDVQNMLNPKDVINPYVAFGKPRETTW